jgi:hypothetical protein
MTAKPKGKRSGGPEHLPVEWVEGEVVIVGGPGARVVRAQFARKTKRGGVVTTRALCIANVANDTWTVTHARSGLRVSPFLTENKARVALLKLWNVTAWSQGSQQLAQRFEREPELRRAVAKVYGMLERDIELLVRPQ